MFSGDQRYPKLPPVRAVQTVSAGFLGAADGETSPASESVVTASRGESHRPLTPPHQEGKGNAAPFSGDIETGVPPPIYLLPPLGGWHDG